MIFYSSRVMCFCLYVCKFLSAYAIGRDHNDKYLIDEVSFQCYPCHFILIVLFVSCIYVINITNKFCQNVTDASVLNTPSISDHRFLRALAGPLFRRTVQF